MSEPSIPLSDLDYGPEEKEAVNRVLDRKWLSAGIEVHAFEEEFARFVGVKHAIAVANATAALQIAQASLDITVGCAVVQPALNFVAAANTTRALGATPVFADIVSLDDPTFDPDSVDALSTSATRAVIVMHYGGYFAHMDSILSECRRRGLAVIEDACHAIGASYHSNTTSPLEGKMAGNLGDIACFSFFSNKNLATGEGGMIVTQRDDLAERARLLRSHGMTTLTWDRHHGHASSYDVITPGFNYRLDDLRAALGRVQLRKLSHNNERRRILTLLYRDLLSDLPSWHLPFSGYRGQTAGHLMVALAPDEDSRDFARRSLKSLGIQTSLHYPCITDFTAYTDYKASAVPLSREFTTRALTLPLFPTMTSDQVETVCAAIIDATASGTRDQVAVT